MNRWLVLSIVLWSILSPATAAEPFLEKIDIFEAGKDGYALYRIPGIVVSKRGVVLAYCEARKKNSGSDWDQIDIMLRRSTDGGKTWLPRQSLVKLEEKFARNPIAVQRKFAKPGELTLNNPVAFADQDGAVHFLCCVDYGRCFYTRSDDDGQTFTKAVEITSTFDKFRPDYDWKVLATGPGHGIQLQNGRLLVPVWLSTGTGGNAHRPSCVAVIFSDDHGKTWQHGDIVACEEDVANPSETVPVQLKDGSVLFNIRNEAKQHFRAISISADGATNWSKLKFDEGLPEPICMGSILRLDQSRILFANPDNPKDRARKNLSVRISYDDAKTWPVVKTIEPGTSGYSDLAATNDGTILCFYERGGLEKNHYRTHFLTVARFNLEWLTNGKDAPGVGKK